MVRSFVPDRGDVVWFDFSPQRGHEQAGPRPAIVLSTKAYNQKSGFMLACPITSKIKNYPFEVRIKAGKIDGVILSDQIKSLDWKARKVKFVQKAPADVVSHVKDLIQTLLEG